MKEETLLELVESGVKSEDFYDNTDEPLQKAAEFESLGFTLIAEQIIKKVTKQDQLNRISKFGYIKISLGNIKDFLHRKVERYNREHQTDKEDITASVYNQGNIYNSIRQAMACIASSSMSGFTSPYGFADISSDNIASIKTEHKVTTMQAITCDYWKSSGIGQFIYTEIPVEQYKTIPPTEVLNELKIHQSRHLFDYFTIAKVENIPDPVLFGRVDGSDDRYFICQWGTDISLDDII